MILFLLVFFLSLFFLLDPFAHTQIFANLFYSYHSKLLDCSTLLWLLIFSVNKYLMRFVCVAHNYFRIFSSLNSKDNRFTSRFVSSQIFAHIILAVCVCVYCTCFVFIHVHFLLVTHAFFFVEKEKQKKRRNKNDFDFWF